MLALLIRKEIHAHLLSYRFLLAFGLFFVLVVSSVQIIALNYDRQLSSYSQAKRAQEEKLSEGTDFRSLQWSGISAEKQPNPLSVFAMGLEREMSRSVTVSNWREAKLGRSKYANPLFVLFPAPDLLYIVNIVASLMAVLFAFDVVCGEQEAGTLRLIMANAVPRHVVLLGKWIGGYIALITPFVISLFTGLALAHLTTALRFTAAQWGGFMGIVGIAALYMSVFFALALMISTLVHRSSTSLVLNFLLWVLLVLVVPNTAPIVARGLAPVPAPGVMAGQRQAIQQEVWNSTRRRMRQAQDSEERQQLRDEALEQIRLETDKVVATYLQKVDSQIELGILLARLSPSTSYVYATAGFAGSGLQNFAGLREYIGRFRINFIDQVGQLRSQRRQQAEGVSDPDERREILEAPVDPDQLPQFQFERRAWGDILVAAQTDLILLAMLNAVFFLGANLGFLRYDLMK